MELIATVGRVETVYENEIVDGVVKQKIGLVAYLNVGEYPMSRSGYIMLGPIETKSAEASLFEVGKALKITVSDE